MNGPILVFGAAGQLGHEVVALARACDIAAIGYNRARADVTDFAAVKAAILAVKPRLVLNAAAFTAVDRAETEPEAAYAANAVGAETVARAAALQQVPVIHLSTDYVFDGTKRGAYVETDPIAPLGVYGQTKAAGEAMVRQANPRHFILRTAWVYGRFGGNFLKTVLRLARERAELRIVADQHGCPTATQDLAEAVFAIDRALARGIGAPGTFHFAGDGATTWHGFASAIVEAQAPATGRRPKVSAIATADYPTAARRPANSELNSSLFASVFGYRARDWQTRARETVEMLRKETRAET
ncbi:MAG: dTDP-4-dehydrorhamnose reductase [Pseudomonadota bacterium]|nr:dTDP-4-dehydrorhamnose reductase [Pseudomonadota bacterium]